MVPLWIIFVVDFFTGANFGSSISNCNTIIIRDYIDVTMRGDPDNYIISLLSVSVLIGSMAGSMSVTYFMDRFGRKKVAVAASVMGAVLNALTCIKVHWAYLFVMRILVGIPSSALTTVVPAWLSELADTKTRGILVVCYQLFICFGIILSSLLLLAIMDQPSIWWISFLVTALFCAFSAVACFFLPDTSNIRKEEPANEVGDENNETVVARQTSELSWKELFTQKRFTRVLIIAFLLGVAQQATGINSILIYATKTFQKIFVGEGDLSREESDHSSTYGSLLLSSVNFISTCIALPFINKLGRKILLFSGFTLCMASQLLLIICYAINNGNPNMAMLITASIVFLFGFEIGPGPCFFVLCSESFPRCVRAKCSGIAFTMNWITNIIVVLIFPFFDKCVWAAYIVYLVFTSVPVIVLGFTIPETKNKSLEEIESTMIGSAPQDEINENVPINAPDDE